MPWYEISARNNTILRRAHAAYSSSGFRTVRHRKNGKNFITFVSPQHQGYLRRSRHSFGNKIKVRQVADEYAKQIIQRTMSSLVRKGGNSPAMQYGPATPSTRKTIPQRIDPDNPRVRNINPTFITQTKYQVLPPEYHKRPQRQLRVCRTTLQKQYGFVCEDAEEGFYVWVAPNDMHTFTRRVTTHKCTFQIPGEQANTNIAKEVFAREQNLVPSEHQNNQALPKPDSMQKVATQENSTSANDTQVAVRNIISGIDDLISNIEKEIATLTQQEEKIAKQRSHAQMQLTALQNAKSALQE
jgi:flagellin-like hook-associated protein FlgL